MHTADSVRFAEFRAAPQKTVRRDAADYYRRPERSTTEYRHRNVQRAQRHSQTLLAHTAAPDYFESMLQSIVSWAEEVDLERVVEIDGIGAMRLGDWLITRVISLAAHGLDVALTLAHPSWTTTQALHVMTRLRVSARRGTTAWARLG